MNHYRVFRSPSGGALEFVKEGWNWPAFFFSWIWALVKKMWVLGFGTILCLFLLDFSVAMIIVATEYDSMHYGNSAPYGFLSFFLTIIIAIIYGMNGNNWREKYLISKGYEYVETVLKE